MDIFVSNTLTKKKELFKPIHEGHVGIYSCGPTVYHYAHIGNMRLFVFSDTLKRMFLFNKYKVNHVMNITDVGHLTSDADEGDDKIEKGAKREGKTVWQVAEFYTKAVLDDMDSINIIRPNTIAKATDHIPEMIEFIKKIEHNKNTYLSNGNVYFDTSKLDDYGKLVGSKQKEEDKKARVDKDHSKKKQSDFVLWFTKHKHGDHAMIWDSPWGEGFPGWHIECSAMSNKYLGEYFDIHTGGRDLIPIHHTNEIAQNEGAFFHDSVRYWMHNEFLVMSGEDGKMSKSTGEFVRIQTLIDKGYSAEDYRYFLLNTHYKKKISFSYESLDAAKNALAKAKNKVRELLAADDKFEEKKFEKYLERFNKEINDDLNTPKCLATMWGVLNNDKLTQKTKLELIIKFDEVLGLRLSEITSAEEIPEDILEIVKHRNHARETKNWKKSDELRDELAKKGYKVLDSKEGSEVRKL